jgi:ABC-type transport system involved in multi-copper enzyme maturation permease subunit
VRAYLHDLRHLLLSRIVLAAVIITLVGGALSYSSVERQVGVVTVNASGFYYYENGAFHIDLWVFDVTGTPLSGVAVELNLTPAEQANGSSVWFYANASTDDSGQLRFLAAVPDLGYFVHAVVFYRGGPLVPSFFGGPLQGFLLENATAGVVGSLNPITPVAENFYSQVGRFLVIWAGPNGSLPTGAQLAYCVYGPEQVIPSSNCSAAPTESLGSLTGFQTVFAPPHAPPGSSVTVELVDGSGAVVDSFHYRSTTAGAPVQPEPNLAVYAPGVAILGEFTLEATPLLVLLGFLTAYWTYAKPRLSATLEPVLVRPVTRRGILLARYLGVLLMITATSAAQVSLLDLGAWVVLKEPLPVEYLAPLFASLVVVGVGFAGLIFLLSHTVRSTSAVVAAGIALVASLVFFWGNITGALTGGNAPASYARVVATRVSLLSPAQFPWLTVDFLSGAGTAGGAGSWWALAGISPGVVIGAGALWILVPLVGAYWRANVSD